MKKSFSLVVIILIVLLVFCLAACTAEETPQKYTVYFGLSDTDDGTQHLSVTEAQTAIRKMITDAGLGYTEYVVYGGYIENDVVHENDTVAYMFLDTDEADVLKVAGDVKQELNLAAVLIEQNPVSFSFL